MGDETSFGWAEGLKEGVMLVEVVDPGGTPLNGRSTGGCNI